MHQPQINLKARVREKINTHIFAGCKEGKFKVLVVDRIAARIVSSVFSLIDVARENIALIENHHRKREPLPGLQAIYFISPTEESINTLIADFKCSPPLYECGHVFFTSTCSDALFKLLGNSIASRYILTLKELNISFLPYESQVFSLDFTFDDSRQQELNDISDHLATLAVTLGQFPAIAYRTGDVDGQNERLAMLVKQKISDYKRFETLETGKCQLLIIDRLCDCTTPLLHDLTFQSMIYDLLEVRNDTFSFDDPSGGNQKHFTFDETFPLWTDLRHLHIADVNRRLPEAIRTFNIENSGIRELDDKSSQVDMKVLGRIVRKLPDYQKRKAEYNATLRLAEECLHRYNKYVSKMCLVEQDIAMGVDVHGNSVASFEASLKKFTPIFLDDHVTTTDKLRIILLFVLTNNGLISEDRLVKLIEHTKLPPGDRVIVDNLLKVYRRVKYPRRKTNHLNENVYDTARWTPLLKDVMEDALECKLPERSFTYMPGDRPGEGGASSSAVPKSLRGFAGSNPNLASVFEAKKPLLIVYIRGGASYPEMRTAYEVTKTFSNAEVYIGSENILTPVRFLETLRHLESS